MKKRSQEQHNLRPTARACLGTGAALILLLLVPGVCHGYSVLTHEAIVDSAWDSGIKPILIKRFPNSTEDELKQARSYAYGGCIIQDLGYYPFGSHFFTNLLHYVRTGDFVENLLRDAQDENEYAFALGAMAHYFADTNGHPIAINPSVPLRYPKVRQQYGDTATYADNPKDHVLVEFSFDVVQVAGTAYAPQAYHDFIGFQVAKPLLERAFRDTYGLEMKDAFFSEDLAIGTYRRAVSKTIPHMTRVAWSQKRDEIEKLVPGIQRRKYIYKLSRRDFNKDFGTDYERPSVGAEVLSFFLRLVPKVGPFKALSFKSPTPKMEALFQQSFATTRERYAAALHQLPMQNLKLPNHDFDTGKPTVGGEYSLADETYADLVDKLASRKFAGVPPEMASDILRFYSVPVNETTMSAKVRKRWAKTSKEVDQLKTLAVANETPGH